jgi:hypothetical protein
MGGFLKSKYTVGLMLFNLFQNYVAQPSDLSIPVILSFVLASFTPKGVCMDVSVETDVAQKCYLV